MRLAKELELKQIDSIYYPVSFNPQASEEYAKMHGQIEEWNAALRQGRNLTDHLNGVLETGTMLDALACMNSQAAIDENASICLLLDRIGGGDEYPGADAVSAWYASNLHIFANLTRIITTPSERVLVIYGQGHAKLLRSFVQGSPDLEFVDPLSVLK